MLCFGVVQEHAGSRPVFPSQALQLRVVELRPGEPAVQSEPGPNPENENSAVFQLFQVRHTRSCMSVVWWWWPHA